MVSSGIVSNDLNSFKTTLNQYNTEISSLSGSWIGDSYQNLVSRAEEFIGEYNSTLEGEMNAFSSACDLYLQYISTKESLKQAEISFNAASASGDKASIKAYSNEMNTLSTELNRLKAEIESYLATASAGSLSVSASPGSITISSGAPILTDGPLTDAQIAQLIEAGRTQIGSPYNSMHYGPEEGDGEGFGCAMFVSYCYNQVLFNGASAQEKGNGGFYGSCMNYWGNVTKDNYDAYNKGFIEVDASEAKPGDIVCFVNKKDTAGLHSAANNCYHVGLYLGDGNMIHSSKFVTNGVGECSIESYLNARNNGRGVRYLHYVGTQALDQKEEDKKE